MESVVCRLEGIEELTKTGGIRLFIFRFRAVPESKQDSIDGPASSFTFDVRLTVTNTVLACGSWPQVANDSTKLVACLIHFVKEELQKVPCPNRGSTVNIGLDSWNEKLGPGPIGKYDLTKIIPEDPFVIEVSTKRVRGFAR
jgi:hypothetical protein